MPEHHPPICSFFALLRNDTVKKIDLLQSITNDIKTVFIENSTNLINSETEEILFDGNFNIDGNEILYVEMALPEAVIEASTNSIGIETLNISTDDIKALFWIENGMYYFQNFDKRKLLQNKNVLFWSDSTYHKFSSNALIVENAVNAIYKDGKFYFNSYANANKIMSLASFFEEASNETIDEFAAQELLNVDSAWLKENGNSMIRKQITLIQKSNILATATVGKIRSSARRFNLTISFNNGKLDIPNDKKMCKDILCFLNEQFYIGLISGKKFRTNSKREA
ncbi:DUF4868 domain-containing protein [Bacteroides sp. 214]|uniref:Kiwa anti-phage protein KwaB-like domain-containing protein n=1 Tax=Bacteroides sp. 214 TaxID=2302935 RepID=UPI0013D882AD|nr:Kiwa anti-phage protein KwaB-like domain-containing protein [Bacteroides sp. 214]NDW12674.1 DUF4868 domain-containing protein [Bacteroides sp. 214]